MMPSYYTAITIGPIYRTLSRAKKTRELWGASMLFSHLMREITLHCLERKEWEVLVPAIDAQNSALSKGHIGTGLTPDRLILRSDEAGALSSVQEIINEVVTQFAGKIGIGSSGEWINYLQFSGVEVKSEDLTLDQKGKSVNAVGKVSELLNVMELQNLSTGGELTFLNEFLNSGFNREPFKKYFSGNTGFETILQVAAGELGAINPEHEAKQLKGIHQKAFKAPHKYIGIVHADGDGIGKLLTGGSIQQVKDISAALLRFGKRAQEMVNEYGGMPIYIGGDDLLFFAPVRNIKSNEKHLLVLLSELDRVFKEEMAKVSGLAGRKEISLSFGLSITYHKFPLNEALALSRTLLSEAKQQFTKEEIKNNLRMEVKLHSGSGWGGLFHLNADSRQTFNTLCDWMTEKMIDAESEELLTSIIYRIRKDRTLIEILLNRTDGEEKLKNFFDNNFDEAVHDKNRGFIDKVGSLIMALVTVKKSRGEEKWAASALTEAFTILRSVKFINQEKDSNE